MNTVIVSRVWQAARQVATSTKARWMVTPVLLWLSTASLFANATVAWLSGGPSTYFPSGAGYVDGTINDDVQYHTPCGLAMDQSGNYLLVADRDNNQIRVLEFDINTTSTLLTYTNNVQASNVFTKPVGVAIDVNYNVFVLNYGNGNNGTVMQFDNEGNLLATNLSKITNAAGLALDPNDNIYVTAGNTIYKASYGGVTSVVTTITNAGTSLQGIVVKHNGLLAVCDAGRDGILLVDPNTGIVTTNAGFHGQGDFITVNNYSYSNQAKFFQPMGVVETGDGTLIVSDYGNDRVKAVLTSGVVTNIYGVTSNDWVSPFPGFANGTVALPDASGGVAAREPNGIVFAPDGSLYVSEDYYHILRHVTGTGLVLPPPPPPAAPTGLTATTNASSVTLTWGSVPGAAFYYIERSQQSNGTYTIVTNVTGTSYIDTNVFAGATYYYVVSAVNASGQSPYSAAVSATLPQTQVPIPQIGYVDFPYNTFGSLFHPVSSFQFNNDALIVIKGTPGTGTYYIATNGPSLAGTPTTNSTSVPSDYADGLDSLQVVPYTIPEISSVFTVAAFGTQGTRPPSGVVQATFTFVAGNPSIVGGNAAQFTISDITADSELYYTVDGSDPTPTNGTALPPVASPTNVWTVGFQIQTNTLFKVRAYRNNYLPSAIVTNVFAYSNFVANTISFGFAAGEASSDFVGSPGQTFYAPITLTTLPAQVIYSLQFNVTVTNVGPDAITPGAFDFQSMLEQPGIATNTSETVYYQIPPMMYAAYTANVPPSQLVTNSAGQVFVNLNVPDDALNLLGIGWVEHFGNTNLYNTLKQDLIQYSQAHDDMFPNPLQPNGVILGGYGFTIPSNATNGEQYQIQIGRASATSDGFGAPGSSVLIYGPTNGSYAGGAMNAIKLVTAGQRKYLAGDAYPFRWFNAGDFGTGELVTNGSADVEQVFESAAYGWNTPPTNTDFYDCMDSSGNYGVYDSTHGYYTNAGPLSLSDQMALFDITDPTALNTNMFGDGTLDVSDVYVTFIRSVDSDTGLNWIQRFWTNGIRAAMPTANPSLTKVVSKSSGVTSKIQPGLNSVTNQPKVNFTATDIQGSANQTIQIPVYASVLGNYPVRMLMLNLTVVPLDGSPDLTTPVSFTVNPAFNIPTDYSYLSQSKTYDNYSAALLPVNPLAQTTGFTGNFLVGTLTVTLPANATSLSAYAVHFDHASASPNGLASFPKQTLTGLITLSSRNTSSYGDGIPDSWRLRYFGTTNNLLSVAGADADGDGYNNWQEYVAGTDPTDATSKLVAGNDQPAAQQPGDSVVCWPSVSGKQYIIQRSPTLFPPTWTSISTNTGTGGNMEIHDLNGGSGRFYRVSVQ